MRQFNNVGDLELKEVVVSIRKVNKVSKGGRKFHFSVFVVVGDGNGNVGYGLGKGNEVNEAASKGVLRAKSNLIHVNILHGTLPHEVIGKHGCNVVLLKPATDGTGIKAGGGVRVVCKQMGISNIISKCIKGRNINNAVKATFDALKTISTPVEVARLRNVSLDKLFNK